MEVNLSHAKSQLQTKRPLNLSNFAVPLIVLAAYGAARLLLDSLFTVSSWFVSALGMLLWLGLLLGMLQFSVTVMMRLLPRCSVWIQIATAMMPALGLAILLSTIMDRSDVVQHVERNLRVSVSGRVLDSWTTNEVSSAVMREWMSEGTSTDSLVAWLGQAYKPDSKPTLLLINSGSASRNEIAMQNAELISGSVNYDLIVNAEELDPQVLDVFFSGLRFYKEQSTLDVRPRSLGSGQSTLVDEPGFRLKILGPDSLVVYGTHGIQRSSDNPLPLSKV
ncbi:MAG: hypothetical protein ABIJ61_04900, partial [bacterium]